MDITRKITLDLMRRSLTHIEEDVDASFAGANWNQVLDYLLEHEVLPLAWHVIKTTPFYSRSVPCGIQARMRSLVMSGILRNEYLMDAQEQLIRLFRENGIHCAVLKGSSVAAAYPRPELRTLGDIDLLLAPEALDAACDLLLREGYTRAEGEHGFHVALHKQGVPVELHFAVSELPESEQAEQINLLMEGAVENVSWRSMEDRVFPALTPARQAISLLLHMERHWIDGGIGLRQLLDWHTFIESNGERARREINAALWQCGLMRLAMTFTSACVSYLGLDSRRVSCYLDIPKQLSDGMMADILDSGNFGKRLAEARTSRIFYRLDQEGDAEPLLQGALRYMNRRIRESYPICAKLSLILPFFWLYLPLRYWARSIRGLRERQSVREVVRIGAARKKLYQELRQLP